MPLGPLPGEFAIRTYDQNTYVTALPHDGTLITSSTVLGSGEKFQMTVYTPEFALIQALNGFYVTVLPEGGLGLSLPIMENSLFTLAGPTSGLGGGLGFFNILTRNGPFLSAVNGGGQSSDAFLTVVTVASDWEAFWLLKIGDLGSGYRYAIRPVRTGGPGERTTFLTAPGGGGLPTFGVTAHNPLTSGYSFLSSDGIFTLVQVGGSQYALQTADGYNYVTAVGGGGLADGDNLHADATRVRDWEIFKIVDQGDASYTIQTISGFYLGVNTGAGAGDISTSIVSPDTPPDGYTAKFEFIMIPNQRQGIEVNPV